MQQFLVMKQREATKKVRQLIKFFPSSFYGQIQDPGSEIRDPGSGIRDGKKSRIQGSKKHRAQTHEHSIAKRGGSKLVLNGIYLPIQLTDWLLVVVELPAHWLIHISLEKNRFGLFCLRKHLFMTCGSRQSSSELIRVYVEINKADNYLGFYINPFSLALIIGKF